MANLTGMPISSLPETTLQEGDQVIGYRADTGKAYRTDLANEVSSLRNEVAELKDSLTELSQSLTSIDISSSFTLASDYANQVSAIYKAGWVYVWIRIFIPNGEYEVATINDSKYYPAKTAYGIYSSQSVTADYGKVNNSRILATGSVMIWANSAFNSNEFISFAYPVA